MTPKEKAKELVSRFYINGTADKNYSILFEDAIECALICVDELTSDCNYSHDCNDCISFWSKVEEEIKKLKNGD
jgi:hypothetical protein